MPEVCAQFLTDIPIWLAKYRQEPKGFLPPTRTSGRETVPKPRPTTHQSSPTNTNHPQTKQRSRRSLNAALSSQTAAFSPLWVSDASPVRLPRLAVDHRWNSTPSQTREAIGVAIWTLCNSRSSPVEGRLVHEDFAKALFQDWILWRAQ
jgi:hypothetical protein